MEFYTTKKPSHFDKSYIEVNNNMLTIRIPAVLVKEEVTGAAKEKLLEKENIVTGLWKEIQKKATRSRITEAKDYGSDVDTIIANYKSGNYERKTDIIRALADLGLERTEIANLTGIIYQQVRQALLKWTPKNK